MYTSRYILYRCMHKAVKAPIPNGSYNLYNVHDLFITINGS